VDDRRASGDRGFTLIEIVIAVAIIATVAAAGVAVSLGARSFAVSTASAEFDHLLDSARTIARETQGATLVFAADAYGDGTEIRVLTAGPNDSLVATTMPVVHTRAAIEEAALGKTPFAFVVHASGALGGRPGYKLGDSTASGEVGCPAAGAFHFVIRAAGARADRVIPCRINLAATGPIAFAPWPPAVVSAPPTPCGGPCQPNPLPTPPSSSPTCPPNFTPTPGGCAPAAAPSGARYHVTASLAAATMTVGASTTLTAQATLTNAAAVAPGTPASLPVMVQQTSDPICTSTPPGAQPSGAQFVLSALAPGTCTATIGADTTGVPGATADTATVTVAVTGPPVATPSPPTCDLVENGKCYHRIVDRTSHTFFKAVTAEIQCPSPIDPASCSYVDAIGGILLSPGYDITPPSPPTDAAHELLFEVSAIVGASKACLPYSAIQAQPFGNPIDWSGSTIGGPVDPPAGFGQPETFSTQNRVNELAAPLSGYVESSYVWQEPTTLGALYAAVAQRTIGTTYTFEYFSADASKVTHTSWNPDFPGCDAAGEANAPAQQYGLAGVSLQFEIYQAQ
jgi:prepilin-type N-terminal cleavage/methylation domain-containing protein